MDWQNSGTFYIYILLQDMSPKVLTYEFKATSCIILLQKYLNTGFIIRRCKGNLLVRLCITGGVFDSGSHNGILMFFVDTWIHVPNLRVWGHNTNDTKPFPGAGSTKQTIYFNILGGIDLNQW